MNINHEFVGETPIQDTMEHLIVELVRAGLIEFEVDCNSASDYHTNECP